MENKSQEGKARGNSVLEYGGELVWTILNSFQWN